MLKKFRFYIFILLLTFVISYLASFTFDYLKKERKNLADSKNLIQITLMKENLTSMILQKQKATLAIALTMANDKSLSQEMSQYKIQKDYYKKLIESFKEHTLYQNIWIQILDTKGNSIYRSWTQRKGDNLLDVRKDLQEIMKTKKISFSVSIGKYDLSLKAMVPVYDKDKFVGIIEVVSHFNSISKQLRLIDVESVVVVKEKYSKQLKYPFTNMFLDQYYIANMDASMEERAYLKKHGVENYFNNEARVENGYIIVSQELKDVNNKVLAYYLMFKKTDNMENLDLDFFMFKTTAIIIIVAMSFAIILSTVLFFRNKKQRKYYKKIMDTSRNMVLISDGARLKRVNKVFFKYFSMYNSVEDFLKDYSCMCDLFTEEEGYLSKNMGDISWLEYLLQNPDKNNKVKLSINNQIYYFYISASLISEEDKEYSIVFGDITLSEHYKIDLEKLTITDALTGIGNRRYFNQKLKEEITRAKRYKHSLSIIMLDIDFFKKINDDFGHDVGDEVLKEYTSFISNKLRETDSFCRIGGEEFVIILPYVDAENAYEIANKFKMEIKEYEKIVPITMSFGVTEYIRGEDVEFIFKRVDSALYEAKNSGRDKVVLK